MTGLVTPTAPKPPRTTTLSRRQGLLDLLLAAAETTIAEQGLAQLRARALAETVGCSVGAIYTVVPDLDALILAVNARTLAAIDLVMRGTTPADPVRHLVHLAITYLEYASEHRQRWAALFQHVMPNGHTAPDWYAAQQAAVFAHVEAPLALLRPELPMEQRALLARTLFSAVHGMVALGLDEKVATLPLPMLRNQVRMVVEAMARGLADRPG